jgi:ATP-dependent DNA helicase PIF1
VFASRAILASRNDEANEINALVVQRLTGTAYEYRSIDSVSGEDGNFYPTEFLNTLNPPGMPPHRLALKVGSPII